MHYVSQRFWYPEGIAKARDAKTPFSKRESMVGANENPNFNGDNFNSETNGMQTPVLRYGTFWAGFGRLISFGYIESENSFDDLISQTNGEVASITGNATGYTFGSSGSFVSVGYLESDNSFDDLSTSATGTLTSITGYSTGYAFANSGVFVTP